MANEDHLARLRQGAEAWNAWRSANSGIVPDLCGAKLIHASLGRFDLSTADLRGAVLIRADLDTANLARADLSEAKLIGASLSGANLARANLIGADLRKAKLDKANVTKARLTRANLSEADLSGADLGGIGMTHLDEAEADYIVNLFDSFFDEIPSTASEIEDLRIEQIDFTETGDAQSRLKALLFRALLAGADLVGADLRGANLTGANLDGTKLNRANLAGRSEAHLNRADLSDANLHGADLNHADLGETDLRGANLSGANLKEAHLDRADLTDVDLSGADLRGASLTRAILIKTNLEGANLTGCMVYGISAWDLKLDGTVQEDLIITEDDQPIITVDDLEVAQFIYLLLNNEKIRRVIETVAKKVVLILGRFTEERKPVLNGLRQARRQNYSPVLFDFDKPATHSFIETVGTLAHLSCFVIADVTDPKIVLEEVPHIVGNIAVPVVPLLLVGQQEPVTLPGLRKNHKSLLDTHYYSTLDGLMESLRESIILPAEARRKELDQSDAQASKKNMGPKD